MFTVRNLWIKPCHIYVTRMSRSIALHIAFDIIRGSRNRGMSWNILPADTGLRLYLDWAWILRVFTAVFYVCRPEQASLWIDQLFLFCLHSLLMSPA
jgi:hypothetical protein